MREHAGFVRNINGNVNPQNLDRMTYTGQVWAYSLEPPSMRKVLNFWQEAIDKTKIQLDSMDTADWIEVKYEDMVCNPRIEIPRIADFLGIGGSGQALKRAITLPRPFPEKHQVKKLSDTEYKKYYALIESTMQYYGYPYDMNAIERTAFEWLREVYRGRYNYCLAFKKNSKSFLKKIASKRFIAW